MPAMLRPQLIPLAIILALAGAAQAGSEAPRVLDEQDLADLMVGSSIQATRGCDSASLTRQIKGAFAAGKKFQMIPLDALPDDGVVVVPCGVGGGEVWTNVTERMKAQNAPVYSDTAIRAAAVLSRHLGVKFKAVIRNEPAQSTLVALMVASALGIPIADACLSGRARPEVQQQIPFINGIPGHPAAFVTQWGDTMILEKAVDDARIDDIARGIAVSSGGGVWMAMNPMSGKDAKRGVIRGSLSQAMLWGRTLREARDKGRDPLQELIRVSGGFRLFQGVVTTSKKVAERGFSWGNIQLQGTGNFKGHSYRIFVKNENIVSWFDERPDCMPPDLICNLDPKTGDPIPTWGMDGYPEGQEVVILGIPASSLWRTPKGVAVFGPRHFGFDFDYVPLEELQKKRGAPPAGRDAWLERPFEQVKAAAEKGDASAQVALGKLYYRGKGAPRQDTSEAVKWLRRAAEQGDAEAQFIVSLAFANGEGVARDATEAVRWCRRAAEQGDSRAQCSLGLMYSKGEGVARDAAAAVQWYRKSADQGEAVAQCNLGSKYLKGEGVSRDAAEAARWYRKAAEQGNAPAQSSLGALYERGDGVGRDLAEALRWYRRAAELQPGKYRAAFRKGAEAFFSNPAEFRDPHALKTLGVIRKPLEDEFGRERVDSWRKQALDAMGLVKSGPSWAGAFVNQPRRPATPSCGTEPSVHFTSELIIGLAGNETGRFERKTPQGVETIKTSDLMDWLKLHIGVDDWSPGMEAQALIAGGVTFGDRWKDAAGTDWSLKKILDLAVERWRANRKTAKLERGAAVPENLLHLAPALIELRAKLPKAFPPYAPVLQEVLECYTQAMAPEGFWEFPGEAVSTGHILEQFLLAERAGIKTAPPPLAPLTFMVEHQAVDGWFQVSMVSGQTHAVRALALALPLLEKTEAK
jgi:DUF917 family protein